MHHLHGVSQVWTVPRRELTVLWLLRDTLFACVPQVVPDERIGQSLGVSDLQVGIAKAIQV